MTLEQFARWLETCGADLGRLPREARDGAARLLETSVEAKRLYRQALASDGILAAGRVKPVDAERIRSVSDAALRRVRRLEPVPGLWRWLFSKKLGAAFASAAFAGVLAGFLAFPLFEAPEQSAISILFSGTVLFTGGMVQ